MKLFINDKLMMHKTNWKYMKINLIQNNTMFGYELKLTLAQNKWKLKARLA